MEPVLDWSEKVKDPAIEAELRATLKSAIDALPGEYRAAFLLRPVHERLLDRLKASSKLFADETTAPVLDPGCTKKGQL